MHTSGGCLAHTPENVLAAVVVSQDVLFAVFRHQSALEASCWSVGPYIVPRPVGPLQLEFLQLAVDVVAGFVAALEEHPPQVFDLVVLLL